MSDVAAEAGVSVPTVSKVLNGRGEVSDSTRARVFKAMSSTRYLNRRLPGRDTSGLIDVVIDGIGTPWALEILRGAEEAAARRGSAAVVTSTMHDTFSMTAWLARLAARRSDGVIFVLSRADHSEIEALRELHTPVVLLDPVGGTDPSLTSVGATNWTGGFAATEHLISRGHTRIGFIGGPPELECSRQRFEGYSAALRRAKLSVEPELVTHGEFMTPGGYAAGALLLDLPDRPTAIFASSDLQAAGVYEAARERDVKIPSELSVVGFDDTAICGYLSPSLTSVRQPLADMAAEAIRLIFELGDNPSSASGRRIELATSLVVRDSTMPLPAR
jgi:DNA-binding LacI/PurR family transcriptional regulator